MFFLLGTSFSLGDFFFFFCGDEFFSPFFQKYFEEKNSLLKIPCFFWGEGKNRPKKRREIIY